MEVSKQTIAVDTLIAWNLANLCLPHIQGVETVEIKDGCEAGKVLRFQCKDCTCDEDGKTASCPKWIKCCQKDEIWSTNACNICYCDGRYRRICKTVACLHRSWVTWELTRQGQSVSHQHSTWKQSNNLKVLFFNEITQLNETFSGFIFHLSAGFLQYLILYIK